MTLTETTNLTLTGATNLRMSETLNLTLTGINNLTMYGTINLTMSGSSGVKSRLNDAPGIVRIRN